MSREHFALGSREEEEEEGEEAAEARPSAPEEPHIAAVLLPARHVCGERRHFEVLHFTGADNTQKQSHEEGVVRERRILSCFQETGSNND